MKTTNRFDSSSIHKRRFSFIAIIFFLFNSCISIHFCNVGYDKPEDYKIDLESGIKPSEIIFNFTKDSNYLYQKNFFLTSFDICCGSSPKSVRNTNLLIDEYKDYFEVMAFTYPDLKKVEKIKEKGNSSYQLKYNCKEYYGIKGLKATLLNLYYKNEPWHGFTTNFIVIANDTVVSHITGSIYNVERYLKVKNTLDSVLVANDFFRE
jgi:hypothetical protein